MIAGHILCLLLLFCQLGSGCLPAGQSSQVRIGYDTYVCLTMAPLIWPLNGSFVRMTSVVKADNFSSLNIQRSWTSASYGNDTALSKFNIKETVGHGLGVAVESMGLISYQRAYRQVLSTGNATHNSTQGVTYPLMMAVINVAQGKVTSINWDDEACVWCTATPSQCGQNVYDYSGGLQTTLGKACWLHDSQCQVRAGNSTSTSLCELNVYVTWTGTDSHGLYFSSSASRFSRMSSTQLAEFTAARQATNALDKIKLITYASKSDDH